MTDQPNGTPQRAGAGAIITGYTRLLAGHAPRLIMLFVAGWFLVTLLLVVQLRVLGYRPTDLQSFFQMDLIAVALITAAVAQATLWGSPGDPLRICLSVAQRAFVPVFAITLLARFLIVIGFVVLVLPGIAMMILFGLSAVIMIAERPNMLSAMRESVLRVWRNFGAVLVSYLVFLLSLLVFSFAAAFVGAIVSAFLPGSVDNLVVGGAMMAMLSVVHTVFAVAVYQAIATAEYAA